MRRNEIDAGSQPVRNLVTNPAFETVGNRDTVLRTNLFTNPNNNTAVASPYTLRTNLITNPSMEASGGNIAVRTNLALNPGVEASTGSFTNIRTNLVTSPRGVSALNPYSTAGTQTRNVAITGHPEGITTAMRITYTTEANVGVSLLDVPESGVAYTMSAWVYHESIMSTPGIQAFAQSGVQSSAGSTPEVGKWVRLSWTWTTTSTNNIGFRVSGNGGTGSGSYLITGMIIEKSNIFQPFFDGATTTMNICTNPSFETNTFGWVTRWYGNGGGAGTTVRSAGTGLSGGASIRKTWTTANTTSAVDVGINYMDTPVVAGGTYTASIYQRSSIATYLTCFIIWKDSAGTEISRTPTTNNVATPAGAWVRGSATGTAPTGTVKADFIFGPYTNASSMPQGSYIDWDWCLIEETDKLNPYYDGTAAAPADFTYGWTATANNSTSVQKAPQPTFYTANNISSKVWQSSVMSHNGTKSLAVESQGTGGYNGALFSVVSVPIGTYTVSGYVYLPAAYGTSGVAVMAQGAGATLARGNSITATGSWLRTKLTFTTTFVGNVSIYFITDNNIPATIGAKFWVDSVMIEAVPDVSPYFDAANPRTNLAFNPSFETSTAGWGGAGMTTGIISKVSTQAYVGTSSLQVVCDGANVNQGAYTTGRSTVKPNRTYTASVWIKADVGKSMRLELGEWDNGANIIGTRSQSTAVSGTGAWQRLSVSRLMGPNADSADVVVRNINAVAHTFFVDALLVEDSDTLNDYYEGTGPFTYAWAGTANASNSEQRAPSVAGITWQGAIPPYQTSAKSWIGTNSLYLEGNPSDTAYQVYAGPTVSGLTVGTNYTLAAWVYIFPGSVGLELQPSGVGSVLSGRTVSTGVWERVYQTFVAASSSHILRLRTIANGKVQAYIDAMILEQGSQTSLPYFDGSMAVPVNLLPNPSFETNTTGWSSILNAGISRVTTEAYVGSASMNVSAIASSSIEFGTPTGTAGIPVTPNKTYTFSHYGKKTGSGRLNNLYIRWYTSAGVFISEASNSGSAPYQATSWTRFSHTGTAPANAAFAAVAVRISPASPAGDTNNFFDAFRFEQSDVANPYTEILPDLTYAWTGTEHASTSVIRGYSVVGQAANKSGSNPDARFWGYQSRDETGKLISKWLSPAGTPSTGWRIAGWTSIDYANIIAAKSYTLYFRYRASGWPANSTGPVQLSGADNNNQVMGADNNYKLNLNVAGWQTYRRTFTASINGGGTTMVYLNLPVVPDPITDSILEVSEAFLVDNSYSGTYFDGSTVSTDPDFSYAWNGTPDASTSKMLSTTITGLYNTPTHGQGMASTVWKSSGTTSLRLIAKNNASADSFTDIRPMLADGAVLKPYTKYTIAGTRYLKAPLTGTLNTGTPAFRVSAGSERPVSFKPGYGVVNTAGASRVIANFTTADTGATAFVRLQQGSMEGNGDVWWDDLLLVEGDYVGPHVDGTKANAKWEGTAHASASIGYPTSLESLVGMPLITATAPGTTALNPLQLASTAPRTYYTVVDAPVDLPNGQIDLLWAYGKTGLSDTPANSYLTFRYQSEPGDFNSILTRRTGGAGAIKTGVPLPGRYVLFGGINESGFIFTGHGGSQAPTLDNVVMDIPHESIQVFANNGYHTHIITYFYAGVHDPATRAQVIKLLAQRHDVPLLV